MTAYGGILWQPSPKRQAASAMAHFFDWARSRYGVDAASFAAWHQWSVTQTADFWAAVAEFTGVSWQVPPQQVYVPPPVGQMTGAQWFAGGRLNFAANLLAPGVIGGGTALAGMAADDPGALAVVAHAEGAVRRTWTRRSLLADVSRCAAALRLAGVGPGDRVAGVLANVPEAVIGMLAAASLGAIWSSCSPDFGAAAVCDRLTQVGPKVVFFTEAYHYNGKTFSCMATIADTLARLPSVQRAVLVNHGIRSGAERQPGTEEAAAWEDFLATSGAGAGVQVPLDYAPMAFDAPLYIMFSSGTTGVPKCIVHGVGGTLLQHKKELLLHSDIKPGDRLLFYTTCGWMMWNWMVSALSTGAALVLFEGSPADQAADVGLGRLWQVVRDEQVTAFGTSPKFVSACMAAPAAPGAGAKDAAAVSKGLSLSAHLGSWRPRTVLSTGAPLLPEHSAWLYAQLGDSVHVASISGGTDIISCFMLGTPLLPVRAGEIQYAGLGMAIDAWDPNDGQGRPVRGEKGELVCTVPFPSMPLGFWHDDDGQRYHQAYFAHYPERAVWRHGDFIEITADGGIIVYGRSDATLNPGGVRIGTAELYRQVELVPEVADAVAIGRRDGDDTHIVLFVKLTPGSQLDQALAGRIRATIRQGLTPRHVPKEIHAVRDIPYTRSGKKVEVAVTQAVHGEPVTNLSAMANPEAMDEFMAFGRTGGSATGV